MSRSRFFRRSCDRKKVSIRGKIIVKANICWAIECLIVEFSLEGATAELDETYDLPSQFMLFEGHSCNIYHSQLVWQNKEAIGVHFIDICHGAERRTLIENRSLGLFRPTEPSSPIISEPSAAPVEKASE